MKEIMSKEVIHMYLTLERLYSSNLRNCVIIITLAVAILTLKQLKFKVIYSLLLMSLGVTIGVVNSMEYYENTTLLKTTNPNLNNYSLKIYEYQFYFKILILITVIALFFTKLYCVIAHCKFSKLDFN